MSEEQSATVSGDTGLSPFSVGPTHNLSVIEGQMNALRRRADRAEGELQRRGSKRHRHTFTALWWHFGPFGEQGVHIHSCLDEDCGRVLIGPGRDCDGKAESHHRETLGTEGSEGRG